MSEARYNIMFDGQLMPGAELETVKDNLAQLFKSDRARIEALFSGTSIAIKRDLSLEQADQYERALQNAGANVHKQVQAKAVSLSLVDTDDHSEASVTASLVQMRCPKCNHEQTKAPECSACGIIIEKYLARQATENAPAASSASPYATPQANVLNDDEYGELNVFTTNGRIGRLRYMGWSFICLLSFGIAYALAVGLMINSPILGALIILPLSIGVIVISLMIGVQRLHDLGWSGWLWLLNLVPVVGTILAFILVLMPGNLGSNRYGPPPPPNSLIIKWLVIGGFIGIVLLTIITLSVVAPAVNEMADGAEQMQRLMQNQSE